MSILLNCVQVSPIQVYCNVEWFKATDRWSFSAHQELRLTTKFVIGFLTSSFEAKDLIALTFDNQDAQAVLSLLEEPKIASRCFYFKISTLCLLNSLCQLLLLACKHSDIREHLKELISTFQCESAVEILFEIVSKGSKKERLKACLLLWILTHLEPHPFVLNKSRMVMTDLSTDIEVKEACKHILISLDNSQLKGAYEY